MACFRKLNQNDLASRQFRPRAVRYTRQNGRILLKVASLIAEAMAVSILLLAGDLAIMGPKQEAQAALFSEFF